ncbi:CPBP family intramembrane glutamic endopeptidase [Verrucomicrobiota bacterium]
MALINMNSNYTKSPCYPELVLAILTGVGHVCLEVVVDGMKGAAETLSRPQHFYNIGAAVVWGCYLLWRLVRTRGVAGAWGFRKDDFACSMRAGAVFAVVALIPLLIYGKVHDRLPFPLTFWLIIVVYPVYGIAQQFVLQALITRNLRGLIKKLPFRVLAASILFCAAHFPNYWLVALTFIAGLGFTWIYEKHRNIWAVGIVHGILGAVAYYLVIGQDPGAELLNLFH